MQDPRRGRLTGHLLALLSLLPALVSTVQASILVVRDTSGSVAYRYRETTHNTGTSELQHMIQTNVRNSFYLYENWLATGHADLYLNQGNTESQGSSSEVQGVTGSLGLNLLPLSRMPLSIHLSRADSRVSREWIRAADDISLDDNVVTERLSLVQSYLGKQSRTQLSHHIDQQESEQRGRFGSHTTRLEHFRRGDGQDLNGSVSLKSENQYDGTISDTESALLRHNYYAHRQFTVNTHASQTTMAQLTDDEDTLSTSHYETRYTQINNNILWRSLDNKTTFNGGLRYYGIDFKRDEQERETAGLSSLLGVTHRFTPRLSGNANTSYTQPMGAQREEQSTLRNDRAALNYHADSRALGAYSYQWNSGLNYSQRYDDSGKQSEQGVTLGHSLRRVWGISRSSRLNMQLSQDYGLSELRPADEEMEQRETIGHRVQTAWQQSVAGVSRNLQLSASDRRDTSKESMIRVYEARYTQNNTLSRRVSLTANLSHMKTEYEYEGVAHSATQNSMATASYRHQRPFHVAGLSFVSDLRYSRYSSSDDTLATINKGYINKFTYQIGKLNASLEQHYRESMMRSYTSYMFNLRRDF